MSMPRHFISLVLFLSCLISSWGQGMHLLMTQIGEGGFFSADKGKAAPLNEASFLPLDSRISVRPRSGIETMAAGYQFRFG